MPAYFDYGFSVREPMWHGEGLVLDAYPADWDEARKLAGLEWEPVPAPVFVAGPHSGIGNVKVDGFQAVARSDNGQVLSVPSSGYSVINHADMGEIIDSVLDADGNVKFETAGSCREGRQVWALAHLDEPWQVPGDESVHLPFLSLLNSHDGSAACKLVFTQVRVVCWNTFQAASADGDRTGQQFTFRHTGNTAEKIQAAKEALAALRSEAEETRQMFTQLAQTPVLEAQIASFTELFLPSPRDVGEQCSDRVHANVMAARGAFQTLHDASPTMDGIRGSAYGLFQASTEYLDHVRQFRTRDTYMGRTLLSPERLKAKSLKLIEAVTAGLAA
jgi:phage/plasmid-like protein (TIGR03299 family)